jgi:hypothetical protein
MYNTIMSANNTSSGVIAKSEKFSYIECKKLDAQELSVTQTQGSQGADVVSATNISAASNYQQVTGTMDINDINSTGWTAGSVIILQFAGGLSLLSQGDGAAAAVAPQANIVLAGDSDLVVTAGSVVTLVYDGTVWREVSNMII